MVSMAPVTLCTTPKHAVQLATEQDIRRFLENHPGASEILTTTNAKRPFFQKTLLTGHQLSFEAIAKSLQEATDNLQDHIAERYGPEPKIQVKCAFYQQPQVDQTWKTVVRLILTGTQVDDYTKLRKSCPKGFDKDVYTLNKVLALEGFQQGRTTSFMEQFVQAQDDDTLVWLYDAPSDDERKYREAKIEFEKTHFKIKRPVGFVRQTETELQLLSRKELFDLYENFFIGSDQFVKLWLRDAEIRTYERFDFLPPPLKCPADVLNTWVGFAADRLPVQHGGRPNPFVDHLRRLFGKDAQYVLKWLASLVQKPGKHTAVALVVVGGQGTGKTTMFELFMKKVLGSRYFGQTNNPENDLFSRFGFLKDSKILVVVDDFNVGTLKMNADPFKSYITGETIPFESKGKMSIELLNCANFVLTTNKHDPVKLDADDRRYAVLEVSDKLKGNHTYFSKLYRYLDDPENIRAIYDLLRDVDISSTNFQAERPITELYQEIKNLSIDKELMYLHHKVDGFERPQEFKGSEYYHDFRAWLAESGFTDYKAKDSVRFGLYMKKVSGVTVDRRSGNAAYYVIDPMRIPNLP
jgi:hypothetical protein